MDFGADPLNCDRRFRILRIVDDVTREAVALTVKTSIGGHRMDLDVLVVWRGRPLTIVNDNRTEMTGRAMLEWTNRTGVDWPYIAPASPSRMASSRA